MATKIPFPSEQGNPITPSGRFNESWRQFFLALRDITQSVTPFDPGPLTVRINELVQDAQAVVPVPTFPRGNTPEEGLVPVVYRYREPEDGTVVFTHGIHDQPDLHALATTTSPGFMSAADKVKVNAISSMPPQSITADVTAANTASDVNVLTETLPANTAFVGAQRRFSMYALVSNGTTAGTLQFWVKVGTTKVFTSTFTTPTTAGTNRGVFVAFEWCFRTIGTTAQAQVSGTLFTNSTAAVTLTPDSLVTPATLDTTVANNFAFGFNWTAANASNTITAKSATVLEMV